MDLTEYQALTGITVADDQITFVEAQIRRTQKILESLLGFTLDPDNVNENFYIEQGKTTADCFCPNVDFDNLDNLEAPDEVVTAYRLYSYNPNDKFYHVDPFTQVHQVKLVFNDVTIRTFEIDDYRANFHNGWAKFIEDCTNNVCMCSCRNCVQLAVDADWLFVCDSSVDSSIDSSVGSCIDEELLYIWADMITHYADCKSDVKSESIGSHSYTKYSDAAAGREGIKLPPEEKPSNIKVLKKYAGPNGTLTQVIVP